MRLDRGRRPARLMGPATTVVLAACLAACSGDDATAPATITVTRSQADASSAVTGVAAPTTPPASTAPAAPAPMDRAFDAALVSSYRMQGEDLVLVIDRLTVTGVDDAVLASSGVPIEADSGGRFGNQREALYEVGVAVDAVFVLTSCTRGSAGLTQASQPLTAAEFVASVPKDAPVLLSYTDGVVSRAEVNPRC